MHYIHILIRTMNYLMSLSFDTEKQEFYYKPPSDGADPISNAERNLLMEEANF